jgi:glycosyltransferase involved in cell wall biosynthesis
VVPSYDEHVVPVLVDAWSRGRPALVNGRDRRLLALAHETGGGLPYTGFAEFEAAIDLLLTTPEVGAALGESGRRHVDARHRWDDVLARYESMLEDVSIQWRSSTSSSRLSAG